MLEDALLQIKMLLEFKCLNSITFLKAGKISVKFYDEPKSMHFKELISVLELAEIKENNYV